MSSGKKVDSADECDWCQEAEEVKGKWVSEYVWVWTPPFGIKLVEKKRYKRQWECRGPDECPDLDSDPTPTPTSTPEPTVTIPPTPTVTATPTVTSTLTPTPGAGYPDIVPKVIEALREAEKRRQEYLNEVMRQGKDIHGHALDVLPGGPSYQQPGDLRPDSPAPRIEAPIPGPSHARDSAEQWVGDIELQRRRAAAEAVLPALQRVVEGSDEMTVAARGMATAWNRDAVPALQRVVDPIHNVTGGFDELIGGLMVTGQSSSELAGALPAEAEAMGHGVYHGLDPARVSFQGLTGDMSDLFEMALQMPDLGDKLPSISYGSQWHGGTPASRASGSASAGGTSGEGPDRVSYDEALDHYQRTSGERDENIEWMRTNPDAEIETGPNAGWTFNELMQDHVDKHFDRPSEFALGGVVPGPVGAPVPALLHGGERVLRSGQSGGGPVNVSLHVHGAVLSERELVRSVREGLIRLNREVTEMGF